MTQDQIDALNERLRQIAERLEQGKKSEADKILTGVLKALRDEPRDE